jgi:hypothetical protein
MDDDLWLEHVGFQGFLTCHSGSCFADLLSLPGLMFRLIRLCLVYNLCVSSTTAGPLRVPAAPATERKLLAAIKRWEQEPNARQQLVYMLEHR